MRPDREVPSPAMQALRNDFITYGRDVIVFDSDLLREAQKRVYRDQAKEAAAARLAREKQGLTIEMLTAAMDRICPAHLQFPHGSTGRPQRSHGSHRRRVHVQVGTSPEQSSFNTLRLPSRKKRGDRPRLGHP